MGGNSGGKGSRGVGRSAIDDMPFLSNNVRSIGEVFFPSHTPTYLHLPTCQGLQDNLFATVVVVVVVVFLVLLSSVVCIRL